MAAEVWSWGYITVFSSTFHAFSHFYRYTFMVSDKSKWNTFELKEG